MNSALGGSTIIVGGIAGLVLGLLLGYLLGRLHRRKTQGMEDAGTSVRQDQFIMLASHYLLTPLSIIQTALAQLQDGGPSLPVEKQQHLYDAIGAGQKRLWILAEQLVLVNEIDHGTLAPQFTPASITDSLTTAVSDIDIFARTKNVRIVIKDESGQFNEGRIDVRRMRQALIALLDNAVKFSNPGSQVEVTLTYTDGLYHLAVKDSGVGMDADAMKRIGERFYRASSIYNFNYEGMGLGLHIAYAIFRVHQGSMKITSALNQGTTVTAEFPML